MTAEGEKPGEGEEALWYLRRLDGGFFTLQTVDYILAWLTMEDDGVGHICVCLQAFANLIRANLRFYCISSKCLAAKIAHYRTW